MISLILKNFYNNSYRYIAVVEMTYRTLEAYFFIKYGVYGIR